MASKANPYIIEATNDEAASSWDIEPARPWREIERVTARYGAVPVIRALSAAGNIRWRLRRGERVLEIGRVK
jgi:hypothetical protein